MGTSHIYFEVCLGETISSVMLSRLTLNLREPRTPIILQHNQRISNEATEYEMRSGELGKVDRKALHLSHSTHWQPNSVVVEAAVVTDVCGYEICTLPS